MDNDYWPRRWTFTLLLLGITLLPSLTNGQPVSRITVDITTQDQLFAGTDDPIQLQIGGQSFKLDNPDQDDFERGNTDRFEIDIPGQRLTMELIRAVGTISIVKLDDSFFGGGWDFGAIRVWIGTATGAPLYDNPEVNESLDGDDLEWHAEIDDPGWNFPEPEPPFPPCVLGDVDTGIEFDSDCDGIPDDEDDAFNPPDADGDGLPDPLEESGGTDPSNPDSDGDGWWDASNRRSVLILTRIKCHDEQEDAGRDELYLAAEDARYPLTRSLDGSWTLDDGSEIFPGLIVDTRVSPPAAAGTGPLSFVTRLRLREGDPTVIEGPTDDTFQVEDINWSESGTQTLVHQSDDAHYELEFLSMTVTFADPNPLSATADTDADGLGEALEFAIAVQAATVQPGPVPGYDGLADPAWRDAFVEIDHVGADNSLPYDAKQMVVSQFRFQNISLRIDDGYLEGGSVTQMDQETVSLNDLLNTFKPAEFATERAQHFRYGLLTDRVQGGRFGVGGGIRTSGFVVGHLRIGPADFGHSMLAEFTPILVMHEMGHTFGLCHRAGDLPPTAPAACPASPSAPCGRYCNISSTEFVDQSANTAMGSDTLFDLLTELGLAALVGAAAGATLGAIIGAWIGGLPGAIAGGILGGLLVGLFAAGQADVFQRLVDYHEIEWAALIF